MSRLHLIRHGQTNWNVERRIQGQTDSQLTDEGRQQAQTIAEEIKSIPFTAAYASSSVRARDTANIILQHHHLPLPLALRDDMREINLGQWEGHLYADIAGQDKQHMHNFRHQPAEFSLPGAETFIDVQKRALAVVNFVKNNHTNQDVLLVSHGIWIKCILIHFAKRPISDFWELPPLSNCCHSIIEFNQDEATIIQFAGSQEW